MGESIKRDLSFCELRSKEVINTCDGRRLGRIIDIIFSCPKGDVRGIVVPFCHRIFFSRNQEVFIPWKCIDKIGEDVILVALREEGFPDFFRREGGRRGRHEGRAEYCPPPKKEDKDDCDDFCDCDDHGKDHDRDHGKDKRDKCDDKPHCDRKCEKCMLFDCAYRWKDN